MSAARARGTKMSNLVLTSADEGKGRVRQIPALRADSKWTALPQARSPRWFIPRAPRAAARNGLRVYRPLTHKGLLAWEAARMAAALGVFGYLGDDSEPPDEIFDALAPHVPPGGTFAVSKSNHLGRWVALLIRRDGGVEAVAKVATNARMQKALDDEAAALKTLAPLLPAPLAGPRVLAQERGLMLLEVVHWRAGVRPWGLPEEVAHGLGIFFRRNATGEDEAKGLAHGDFAPWNLFRTPPGWTILDWEHAEERAEPFFDVLHYVTMAHSLLGHPSRRAILDGVLGYGWIGRVLAAYARGADISLQPLPEIFISYLRSRADGDGRTRADRVARRARTDLLAAMGVRSPAE